MTEDEVEWRWLKQWMRKFKVPVDFVKGILNEMTFCQNKLSRK